ncbi:unnamed protein product [Protopolystoma xenopodis]|uniref:Uncharacterized protein n=1 Tax=Protopolystoma xenopodis TaxID=117903 RepID=A0A448X4V2_9PLAT|nr:unnamed protein product [Protopolystoma xenopodis]
MLNERCGPIPKAFDDDKVLYRKLNLAQGNSPQAGLDLNLYPAYAAGWSGQGIISSIIDDGLDTLHDDLRGNLAIEYSVNMNEPAKYGLSVRGPADIMPREEE